MPDAGFTTAEAWSGLCRRGTRRPELEGTTQLSPTGASASVPPAGERGETSMAYAVQRCMAHNLLTRELEYPYLESIINILYQNRYKRKTTPAATRSRREPAAPKQLAISMVTYISTASTSTGRSILASRIRVPVPLYYCTVVPVLQYHCTAVPVLQYQSIHYRLLHIPQASASVS